MIMEHKYFRRKEAKRIIIYHRTKRNEKMLDDGILSLKKKPNSMEMECNKNNNWTHGLVITFSDRKVKHVSVTVTVTYLAT